MTATAAITDDFSGASLAAQWTTGSLVTSGGFNAAVTVAQGSGVLTITPVASTAGANYNGIHSAATDFTNSHAYVLLSTIPNQTGGLADMALDVGFDSSNFYRTTLENTTLFFQHNTANAGVVTLSSIAYVASTMQYIRMRHGTDAGGTGDTVFWDTSADTVTWTQRASVARGFAITAAVIELYAGTNGSLASPGTAVFDNLNTTGPLRFRPFSARPRLAGLLAR